MTTVLDLGVKLFGGGDYSFTVNVDTTTVKDLKILLEPETGLPVDDQILCYHGRTLLDTQTLREVGVHGNVYKVILGSKTHDPCIRREDASTPPPIDRFGSSVHRIFDYEFKGMLSPEDEKDLGYTMWHMLRKMVKQVSLENLELVSAESLKNHHRVLRERKENYLRNFMDSHWENLAMDMRMARLRVEKTKRALAAEKEEEEAEARERAERGEV